MRQNDNPGPCNNRVTYDDYRNPRYGGGGPMDTGGGGGGVIRLTVGGACTINSGASMTASSTVGSGASSGAGGSIYLSCQTIGGTAGASAIQAVAATAGASPFGSGGGGRIAMITTGTGGAADWSGSFAYPVDLTSLTSFKSYVKANGGGSTYSGGAGTIYLKNSSTTYGDLIIDNADITVTANTGITPLMSATDNGNILYSTPDANTVQITSASTPYVNKINIFSNYRIHIFSLVDPADPRDISHQEFLLNGNGANTFTTSGSPFPVVNSDYYYRFVHRLDHIDVGGKAQVNLQGADLYLTNCDLHSTSSTFFDIPSGSLLTGNSFASDSCSLSAITTTPTTVNFNSYFMAP